jgi:transposase
LDQVIDWEKFRPTLEKILEGSTQGPGGRPRSEVVVMFKILVLQRYYNLSEEQTQYQIKDRLSFQKFLGLTLADAVADKNTIGDFKQRLIEAGVMEKLFERFKGHLLRTKG